MHDKKTTEKKQARLERLSEVALTAYINAHCEALKHESEDTVGKVLTNFVKAIHSNESNDMEMLATAFTPKLRDDVYTSLK